MRKIARFGTVGMLFAVVALAGVAAVSHEGHEHGPSKAICVMTPTEGNSTSGVITFTKTDKGILIEGKIQGLKPNATHGFHIHQFGDISSPDGTAAGGHFNPHGADHAGPEAEMRHVGDLGNIESDADGNATYKRVDAAIKFTGDESIIGRGMIIHADPDDLKSQPTGAAGARIAQGVIGVANDQ